MHFLFQLPQSPHTQSVARRGGDDPLEFTPHPLQRAKPIFSIPKEKPSRSITKRGVDDPQEFTPRPLQRAKPIFSIPKEQHNNNLLHKSSQTPPSPSTPEPGHEAPATKAHAKRSVEADTHADASKPAEEGPKRPTGRVVWFGQKLARLFYHGRGQHNKKNGKASVPHKAEGHKEVHSEHGEVDE